MIRFFIFIILTSVGIVAHAQFFEKLPTSINSKQIEYAPSISADGRTIIYQSNKDGKYKLYIAQKEGSEWKSKPIHSINNYKSSNSLIAGSSISHDGNYIYFFASFPGSIRGQFSHPELIGEASAEAACQIPIVLFSETNSL